MNMSRQHQIFNEYAKPRINNEDDTLIICFDDFGETYRQYYQIVMKGNIRGEDCYVLIRENDDNDWMTYAPCEFIDENKARLASEPQDEEKLRNDGHLYTTPMIDACGYASRMEFDWISKNFFDDINFYWDDMYMDEMIEE